MRTFIILFICCLSISAFSQDDKLEAMWQKLAFGKSECLTGGQYVRDSVFGSEACVLTRSKEWAVFFAYPKDELTTFLINKMKDTATTKIHTCPFFKSTEGELAVYCLQKIYLKNWYDFDEFSSYKKREITSSVNNHQAWLQAILMDNKQREVLENLWKMEMRK